jgi:radical SAM superfamily enzyme YgiQ (UPF0313 family)
MQTEGRQIVLSAPLTEMIDHAGYFIQMGMASMPVWLQWVFDKKYPGWNSVKRFSDGSAQFAPAGLRVLEKVLAREFGRDEVVVCYPEDLEKFVGPRTRAVAVSTHNPVGVTFASGVYASIFGTSKETINAHHARLLFEKIAASPQRSNFKLIVGGSGGWQILKSEVGRSFGIDCVVDGRSESHETINLFRRALDGMDLPVEATVAHPHLAEAILVPDKPTTFGVVEMTTGCGRRCQFCMPDLNPQLAVPKETMMSAVAANVKNGNEQISLATEDMFIWGQVHTNTPFFFPNREALLDLYSSVVNYPGVKHHVLSHCTIAPAVVDPILIEKLSEMLLDKSPIHLHTLSSHPKKKALVPLIGLETGSVRMAREVMPSKGVPFSIEDWPSVVLRGLEVLNRNNWFPMLTLMIGNPGETDDDVKATLDLLHEMECRNLFGFMVPSVFTPLVGTRMEGGNGVRQTRQLTPLQWQLIMRCWKLNLRPGLYSWWGPAAWRIGAVALWLTRLRRMNGPNFTYPLLNFASALPESWMHKAGKLYRPKRISLKTRAELLASIRPGHWKYLRADCGDLPEAMRQGEPVTV